MKEKTNHIFKAIADPTRREIFHLLVLGSALSISQLSTHFDMSRQGITKHVKILEEAEMIAMKKEGREQICHAQPKSLKIVKDWLAYYDKFWDDKLQDLSAHLDKNA
ncbi:MAG: metalloregulator ArsR/SmtB family transcription factor [Crocinitomicaceae bacterium]